MYEIRQLSWSDLPAALEVYRQCEDFLALGPVATASTQMVRADMELSAALGGKFCGIFAADGKLVGVVDFIPQGFEGNSEHAFIELLMIARGYRSKGLGAAVMAQVETEIRQQAHVKAILCGVQVNNPAAQRFWNRLGYVTISLPEALADGTTAYRLCKVLS